MATPDSPDYDPAQKYFSADVTADDGKLGMRYVKTEVVHVAPDSWAQKNGVEIDDEILEVGNPETEMKIFKDMTEKDKFDFLTGPRPFTAKFKRPQFKDTYYKLECNDPKLGFKYNKLTITSVSEGGWASKNGVVRGDQLIEVNTQLFEKMSEQQIFDLLRGPRPLEMQFKRPAQVHIDKAALTEADTNPEKNRGMTSILEKGPNYKADDVANAQETAVELLNNAGRKSVLNVEKLGNDYHRGPNADDLLLAQRVAAENTSEFDKHITVEEEYQGGLFGACCSCKNVSNETKIKVLA